MIRNAQNSNFAFKSFSKWRPPTPNFVFLEDHSPMERKYSGRLKLSSEAMALCSFCHDAAMTDVYFSVIINHL